MNHPPLSSTPGERGVALLIVVFFLSLATILVFEFARTAEVDQRASRSFVEGLQDDYLLKSAVNVGRLVLEAPKLQNMNEDWLGEPWAQVGGAPDFDIPELRGKIRLMIVDETSKIEVNSIASPVQGQPDSPANKMWRDVMAKLFETIGFEREQFGNDRIRTPGNVAFKAADQVAVIHDWIDGDNNSYSVDGFAGQGAEAQLGKQYFSNRQLRSVSELLVVPGITLERMQRLAPFVRVSPPRQTGAPVTPGVTQAQLNVNTVPYETLLALGIPETLAQEMAVQRLNAPITSELLRQNIQIAGAAQLQPYLTVKSDQFSIIARVESSNRTKWVKAIVTVTGSGLSRKTAVRSMEFS
jgi:type II secretory pathway component PulK